MSKLLQERWAVLAGINSPDDQKNQMKEVADADLGDDDLSSAATEELMGFDLGELWAAGEAGELEDA